MAKKGKGKGKKGKGKGKKGKGGDDDDESGKPQLLAGFSNAVNMKEVTLAMMEQQKQTERYENMRREHAAMEAQMATNKKAMQTLEQTLDDNNEYLQGIIDEERLKNAKLRQEHGVVVAELEEHRRYHEISVEKLTEQFAAKQHKLEARIAEQDAKLETLLEFERMKETLDADLARARDDNAALERAHADRVRDLERRIMEENERLYQECKAKVKEKQQEMQAKMQNRLDTTTKRTIEENQQMNTELRYQARQTSALLDENDRLKRQAAAHAKDIGMLKGMLKETARRIRFYERLFRKMQGAEKQREAAYAKEQRETQRQLSEQLRQLHALQRELGRRGEAAAILDAGGAPGSTGHAGHAGGAPPAPADGLDGLDAALEDAWGSQHALSAASAELEQHLAAQKRTQLEVQALGQFNSYLSSTGSAERPPPYGTPQAHRGGGSAASSPGGGYGRAPVLAARGSFGRPAPRSGGGHRSAGPRGRHKGDNFVSSSSSSAGGKRRGRPGPSPRAAAHRRRASSGKGKRGGGGGGGAGGAGGAGGPQPPPPLGPGPAMLERMVAEAAAMRKAGADGAGNPFEFEAKGGEGLVDAVDQLRWTGDVALPSAS